HFSLLLFFLLLRPPPLPTLFPYTTLFRSGLHAGPLARPAHHPRLPGGQGRLRREAPDAQRGRGPRDGRRRAKVQAGRPDRVAAADRKSTRLNSSHRTISYAVFCLKKKKIK